MPKFIEPDELLLNYGDCPSECRGGYGFCTTEDHRRCAMKIYSSDSIVDCPKVSAIPLDRIKLLRQAVIEYRNDEENDFVDFEVGAINGVIDLIDKLIAESEDS